MPELPEVETVRRSLLPHVVGRSDRTISQVTAGESLRGSMGYRVLQRITPVQLPAMLVGRHFGDLDRKGKLLIAKLEKAKSKPNWLLVHLGMTGQWTFRDPAKTDLPFERHPTTGLQRAWQHAPDQHTHIILTFSGGCQLLYRDIRKFGRWSVIDKAQLLQQTLDQLGPDPLTDQFQLQGFAKSVENSQRAIKAILLDQQILAGVGNIYADEALFLAGIDPRRRGSDLSANELTKLYEAVRSVLQKGVDHGGTSLSDYVNADGEMGRNQETLLAYGRHGENCTVCQSILVKTTVAQRTTSYCSVCQK